MAGCFAFVFDVIGILKKEFSSQVRSATDEKVIELNLSFYGITLRRAIIYRETSIYEEKHPKIIKT